MPHDALNQELRIGDRIRVMNTSLEGIVTELDDSICGATYECNEEQFFSPTNRLQKVS